MKIEKNLEIFNIISSKTNFEILNKILKANKPTQFKEFKLLLNPKTSKKYSTRTISLTLKKFEKIGIIKTELIKNTTKKNFGYAMTQKGIKTFNIIKEATKEYEKLDD